MGLDRGWSRIYEGGWNLGCRVAALPCCQPSHVLAWGAAEAGLAQAGELHRQGAPAAAAVHQGVGSLLWPMQMWRRLGWGWGCIWHRGMYSRNHLTIQLYGPDSHVGHVHEIGGGWGVVAAEVRQVVSWPLMQATHECMR